MTSHWAGPDDAWQAAFEQDRESFVTGNIAVGAVASDAGGVVRVLGRNRVLDEDAPGARWPAAASGAGNQPLDQTCRSGGRWVQPPEPSATAGSHSWASLIGATRPASAMTR